MIASRLCSKSRTLWQNLKTRYKMITQNDFSFSLPIITDIVSKILLPSFYSQWFQNPPNQLLLTMFTKSSHPAFSEHVFKILPPSSHRWYQLPPPVDSNKETRSSMWPAQTSQPLWLWWFENYYQFENQHSECPFKQYKRLQLKNNIPTNKADTTQINRESSSSLTSTSTETPSDLLDLVELSLSVTVYPHCTDSEVLTMIIVI